MHSVSFAIRERLAPLSSFQLLLWCQSVEDQEIVDHRASEWRQIFKNPPILAGHPRGRAPTTVT
eukprot:scaffold3069_cov215-Amphora_coffeaeformis.AAC.2